MVKLNVDEIVKRIKKGKSIQLKFGVLHEAINKVQIGCALIDPWEYEWILDEYEKDMILFFLAGYEQGYERVSDYFEYLAIKCFINDKNIN
ncbi:hypothetical protein [Lysinibacillus sp. FSL M8-0355]|uniref:hypothetical protein n=1 Tax=Lysinibacillus sp. FSL M8-0355 TaxID=2921719 RepID=UPI0030F78BEB